MSCHYNAVDWCISVSLSFISGSTKHVIVYSLLMRAKNLLNSHCPGITGMSDPIMNHCFICLVTGSLLCCAR